MVFNFSNWQCNYITSFSREGRALNQFKIFPLNIKEILLSKFYIGMIGNIPGFISTNVLIALFSSNLIEFILFELLTIIYMVGISIIQFEIDLDSMELKWVDIKDLLKNGHVYKILKPFFIFTSLPLIYSIVVMILFNGKLVQYLIVIFMIFMILIISIYSSYSFKKILTNMKLEKQ